MLVGSKAPVRSPVKDFGDIGKFKDMSVSKCRVT